MSLADPRHKLTPAVKPKKPTLNDLARRNGWTWKQASSDCVTYSKDGRTLDVFVNDFGYRSGILRELGGNGIRVDSEHFPKVFNGAVCICPTLGPEWWRKKVAVEECPVPHPFDPDDDIVRMLHMGAA